MAPLRLADPLEFHDRPSLLRELSLYLICQESGIAADADKTARSPGVQPRHPEHVCAVHRGDAATMDGIAGAIENRQIDPGPIGAKPGRPDDAGDAGGL